MAVSLAQSAVIIQDDLQGGVVDTFVQESVVLDRLPLKEIASNVFAYNEEATLPNVQFRGVNEPFLESTGTWNPKTERLSILGGDADLDTFLIDVPSETASLREEVTRGKIKANSYMFQNTFFNGDTDVDPKAFDGLRKRLIGSQVIDAGENGFTISGNPEEFFDLLDLAISRVPGINGLNGAIYMNASATAKLRSAGRKLGGTEIVREDLTSKRVLQYNGIAVLDPGDNQDGVAILGQNETTGTATDTSSIYVVKFGESEVDQGVTGLTRGGISVRDLGEIDEKPAYRTRLEFFCGVAVFGGKAAARIRGIK